MMPNFTFNDVLDDLRFLGSDPMPLDALFRRARELGPEDGGRCYEQMGTSPFLFGFDELEYARGMALTAFRISCADYLTELYDSREVTYPEALRIFENVMFVRDYAGAYLSRWIVESIDEKTQPDDGDYTAGAEEAGRDAFVALLARPYIDKDLHGNVFTRAQYQNLTLVWRLAIGPVHPDDSAELTIACREVGA